MFCDLSAYYQPPFFRVTFVYLNLNTHYFSSFVYFFLLFFSFILFLLPLSTFKLLNTLYSKFERLKISESTSEQQKSRVQGWGISSIRSFKILNFQTIRARWIKFSEWKDITNKQNQTKTGCATMRVSPQNEPSKIQTFRPFKLGT